jgi:RNA polymerase sigma-70 factor (ECF subfamily)
VTGTSASGVEEKELLDRLRRGDADAFESLVRETTPRLLAVTRRLLRSEEDAQDAVQEAFLSAFRSLERFQGDALLSTWLHRIAVNAALMRLRSRRRKPEESLEDLLPRFLEDGHHEKTPAPWRENLDVALESRELRAQIREAIDGLPDAYRNILMLRDIEELDTAEVAEILGISAGAVKTRLHRARMALRTQLDPTMRAEAS